MPARRKAAAATAVRCYTRAAKNARFLQEAAPEIFARDPAAGGFGTGVPLEILRGLHRIPPDSPVLNRHQAVAGVLRTRRPPAPGRVSRDALFSGTIHFAQVTFHTSGGDLVIPAADMNQIAAYAQHAIVPISEYAAQYGPNTVNVSPVLLTKTVSLTGTSFSDGDLQGWVNDLASANGFGSDHCIFVPVPPGVSAHDVGENAGYHKKANIPYVVAGVTTGLTLADNADVYAMVVSHETAEMVVDPNVDGNNPEGLRPLRHQLQQPDPLLLRRVRQLPRLQPGLAARRIRVHLLHVRGRQAGRRQSVPGTGGRLPVRARAPGLPADRRQQHVRCGRGRPRAQPHADRGPDRHDRRAPAVGDAAGAAARRADRPDAGPADAALPLPVHDLVHLHRRVRGAAARPGGGAHADGHVHGWLGHGDRLGRAGTRERPEPVLRERQSRGPGPACVAELRLALLQGRGAAGRDGIAVRRADDDQPGRRPGVHRVGYPEPDRRRRQRGQ